MTPVFRNASVRLQGRTLTVQAEVVNTTASPWVSSEGWAAGYHLFDEPTSTLVLDGERTGLDLIPGGSQALEVTVTTPPEPGEYSIYVSAMQEHVAWWYERGWPFVLVDVVVDDEGNAELRRWRIADMRGVRARRALRSLGRALTLPFTATWHHRSLIRTMVKRDVLSRYTGSFGGAFWTILNPLMLMLTYFFVFGIVMNTKFGNDSSRTGFALYFLAGMMPWLAFSEAIGRAPFVLLEHRNFIKKLVFPVETLPVNVVISGLVTEFFGLGLFIAALLIIRGSIPWTALYLPLAIVPQILLTAGLAWFLSALAVFIRDLGQVIGYLLTVMMFLTPIFYPETAVPKFAANLMQLNPIYVLVRAYRATLLEGRAPDFTSLAGLTLIALIFLILGHAWFYKLRKSFPDLI
ncbi:MAG TPA: ABC transporter permease [Bryobacteraceae bacterium]|nr:ABC transporter permease [Bryobacteraceae bacterium]